jgi:hypothetical protein
MRRLLFVAVLFLAVTTRGDSLRLVAPASGTALRGGHFARLTWTADHLDPSAEEWEAFLSVDGGRYYSVRLTPHLDIDIRSFDVFIPNVDSHDARVLIRTGNERTETTIELPQRLEIRAEAGADIVMPSFAVAPESARPEDPAVVFWSDGQRVNAATPSPSQLAATVKSSSASSDATFLRQASRTLSVLTVTDRQSLRGQPQTVPRSERPLRDALLLSSRLNV